MSMNRAQRDEFLKQPRIAILSYVTDKNTPMAVPIWFDWDGEKAHFFTGKSYSKVKHIQANPNVSLMIANSADQIEAWVSIEGEVEFGEAADSDLVLTLADRYWEMDVAYHKETRETWAVGLADMLHLTISPKRILSYSSAEKRAE